MKVKLHMRMFGGNPGYDWTSTCNRLINCRRNPVSVGDCTCSKCLRIAKQQAEEHADGLQAELIKSIARKDEIVARLEEIKEQDGEA